LRGKPAIVHFPLLSNVPEQYSHIAQFRFETVFSGSRVGKYRFSRKTKLNQNKTFSFTSNAHAEIVNKAFSENVTQTRY
jgi:hypothetical protein